MFKIVPMLNPDGVVNGNYRCSLAGCDLNRRWAKPSPVLHPTIYTCKELIKSFGNERKIALVCDLHGHSRKSNVFMYGCLRNDDRNACKMFPFILEKLSNCFSFEDSRFGVQKSKASTARVALFKELGSVDNVFTLESSFSGCSIGVLKGQHLSIDDL